MVGLLESGNNLCLAHILITDFGADVNVVNRSGYKPFLTFSPLHHEMFVMQHNASLSLQ
jgi:hypothetical protein